MSAVYASPQLGNAPVQYKRQEVMFILHLIILVICSFFFLLYLLGLGMVMTALAALGVPHHYIILMMICNGEAWVFALSWIILSISVKSYFLTGNQWLKCLPIAIHGVFQSALAFSFHGWANGAIFLVVYSLVYVHHVKLDWWKPYKIDQPTVVHVVASPMVQPQPVYQTQPVYPQQ